MATVLIVEDDGLVARQMALAVRLAGHFPVCAMDARSAIREATARPDAILLDLGLPDASGETLLDHLHRMPETAHVPIVVVTGKTDRAVYLRDHQPSGLADILLKPVNNATVAETVQSVLEAPRSSAAQPPRRSDEFLRHNTITRLIAQGPDRLASQVYRRLCADRAPTAGSGQPRPLGWPEIARWSLLEGLVNEEEARLLCETPRTASPGPPRADTEPSGPTESPPTGSGPHGRTRHKRR